LGLLPEGGFEHLVGPFVMARISRHYAQIKKHVEIRRSGGQGAREADFGFVELPGDPLMGSVVVENLRRAWRRGGRPAMELLRFRQPLLIVERDAQKA
jgi:hypothetical protein